MLLRLLMLLPVLVLALMVGPGAGDAAEPTEERELGGEGFGRVMAFVGFLGVVLLAIILILAIMALFGVFVDDALDPEV